MALSMVDEADITSQASGFHYLDLDSSLAEVQPKSRSWFSLHDNRACMECRLPIDPKDAWVSVTLAASLCKLCAGQHRALGTHLSAVKSLTLDTWSSEDVERLWAGGNGRLRAALSQPRSSKPQDPEKAVAWLRSVYSSPEANLHREQLDREVARSSHSQNAPSSKPTVGAHADALAQRPGYFRTKGGMQGLGFAGPDAALNLASLEDRRWPSALKGWPSGLLRSAAAALGPQRCLRGCLPEPRHLGPDLPSLEVVIAAEGAGGPRAPSIFERAERGDAAEVEQLVRAGRASVDDVDDLGWTPLFYAAKFGRDAVCELLLRLAPAPHSLANAQERGGAGRTPLHYAAENGHGGCVYLLLRAGAAPDGPRTAANHPATRNRRTPLRVAAFNRRSEAVEVLLGFGADPAFLPDDQRCEKVSAERVAACAGRFAWLRTRPAYLLRDKAEVRTGSEYALVKLLRKPTVFASVAKYL